MPMSPVYPQVLEQIQQLSVNGGGGPAAPATATDGNSPVLGPRNGFFGVVDFTAR